MLKLYGFLMMLEAAYARPLCRCAGTSSYSISRNFATATRVARTWTPNRGHGAERRLGRLRCRSSISPGSNGAEGGTAEAALAAAEHCVELFAAGRKDAVVDYLPEAVIDRCLVDGLGRDPATSGATFDELLSMATPNEFKLDAFAQRALLLRPPAAARALSTLRLAPDRCLQRFAVTCASGEEAVLTLDMALEETLEPTYRSVRLIKRWFLRGVTGEPAAAELPAAPAPRHGPESVVAAQLEALRCQDARSVFAFASPANRAGFGDNLERFAQCLGSPAYRPLLGHLGAEILRSVQLGAGKSLVIVGLTSDLKDPKNGVPKKFVYSWVLGLGADDGGESARCWMTDAVQPSAGTIFVQ